MLMQTTDAGTRPRNLFLSGLTPQDRALIEPCLTRHTVEGGAVLFVASEVPTAIYFPETIIVSIERASEASDTHPHLETAIVGHEGMVGWSAMMGGARATHNAVVQTEAGTMLRIAAGDMAAACARSSTLPIAVLRFAEVMMVQMAQAIGSHLRDTIERRICRWLLMRHDRMFTDHLPVKHDAIAANLGIRRASVTDCLHVLEGDHLVKCFRGRMIIRNRAGLEARAADAYGAAENHYRALIGPFGRA